MDPNRAQHPLSETSEPVARPPSPWRRTLLIFTGLSLLAAGVALNAERLALAPETEPQAMELEIEALDISEQEHKHKQGQGQRHRGEEGVMGHPSSKRRTGMYAMKGPKHPAPQMARSVDPTLQARAAGVLGQMQQQSGHFLASPYGGAFAIGNDRRYDRVEFNRFVETIDDPHSTFSIDVDTASYAHVRRFVLESGQAPPPDIVRTEELINYFDYDYPEPSGDAPFSVTTEVAPAPWAPSHRIVHVGIQGKTVDAGEIPPRNLVFLIDVSGSMSSPDKLGLVQKGLSALVAQMNHRDRISLVVYAGAAGAVLPPTSGADHRTILDALERLESGGSTNGSEGIHLAYQLAQQSFIEGGINRVLIATDGDFNVGTTGHAALMELIAAKRETGVFLSVLGVGGGYSNDHMMEQLADKGNGNYAYLDGELEARKVLVEESGAMLQTIAKDVKIQVEFDPDQVSKHRLIGYENRVLAHRDFDDDTKDAGEIGAGHTVTALYEVIPTATAGDDPLMTLKLRYKEPDGDRSKRISIPVRDQGRDLAASSDDYRFSAAVAMLSQKMRGHDAQSDITYAEIATLALGSMGTDPHCYRHQFVEMAVQVASIGDPSFDLEVPVCRVKPPSQRSVLQPVEDVAKVSVTVGGEDDEEPFDWSGFFVEVLRLLPPLLALPVFAMAFWRPRRRRDSK